MAIKALSAQEVAAQLGISERGFHRIKFALLARGVKRIRVGRQYKYLEPSLDRVLLECADKGIDLC